MKKKHVESLTTQLIPTPRSKCDFGSSLAVCPGKSSGAAMGASMTRVRRARADRTGQRGQQISCLVAHPTARKWVMTPVINGMFVGLIHFNHWGYNPLTSRGMSHQVSHLIIAIIDHKNLMVG